MTKEQLKAVAEYLDAYYTLNEDMLSEEEASEVLEIRDLALAESKEA